MKKIRFLTVLLLICSLLTLTACDATLQEQTATTVATTEQMVTVTTTTLQTTATEPPVQTTVTTLPETMTEATTVAPAQIKSIRSIFLHTYNAYAASSAWYGYNFYYFTPDLTASGRTKKTPINTDDPLKTENMELLVSKIPEAGTFDALCEELWAIRFDLLPETVTRSENGGIVMDGSDYYLTVTFEDGTVLTSAGYAARNYNRTYKRLFDLLIAYSAK